MEANGGRFGGGSQGGLDADFQTAIYSDIANYINPASSRQANIAKQSKQRSYEDIVRLAAVLERIDLERKTELGGWLLKRLEKPGEPEQTGWALGRVGARVPFYGSSHNVIQAEIATQWLQVLLDHDWKKNAQAAFAATLIARKSGDRARDIDPITSQRVIDKLRQNKMPMAWLNIVEQYVELGEKEKHQFLGESLPPGLKLI